MECLLVPKSEYHGENNASDAYEKSKDKCHSLLEAGPAYRARRGLFVGR